MVIYDKYKYNQQLACILLSALVLYVHGSTTPHRMGSVSRRRHSNLYKRQIPPRNDATVLITGENTRTAKEGESVTLHCIADVVYLRQVRWSFGNGAVNLTVDDRNVVASDDTRSSRIVIARNNNPPSRITTFSLTVNDVSVTDAGKYRCDVIYGSSGTGDAAASGDPEFEASAEITISVMYFPQDGFPKCTARGGDGTDSDTWVSGHSIDIECRSEIGNPTAALVWRWHRDERPQTPTFIQQNSLQLGTMVRNSFGLIAHRTHDNDVFVCNLTSAAFPGRQATCQIGPVTILNQENAATDDAEEGSGDWSTPPPITTARVTSRAGEAITEGYTADPDARPSAAGTIDEKTANGQQSTTIFGELYYAVILAVAAISIIANVFLGVYLLKLKLCSSTGQQPATTKGQIENDDGHYMEPPQLHHQPQTPLPNAQQQQLENAPCTDHNRPLPPTTDINMMAHVDIPGQVEECAEICRGNPDDDPPTTTMGQIENDDGHYMEPNALPNVDECAEICRGNQDDDPLYESTML